MNIVDWFDINNFQHLRAWKYLEKTGSWPKGFIPEGMQFPIAWQVLITGKLANAYLQLKVLEALMNGEYL